ncbi:hypothetical protein E2C01_053242 [Portunus trituberculatus]|uniref:Uncharacterized protein n=1 Tax=Portunus trituberculatus TaxID=210409 RepID=A0A5B7GPT4_PORTR|nr:hypothetical protein [Portunus trituberculatus]
MVPPWYSGTIRAFEVQGPRGLQVHKFKSCPRSECSITPPILSAGLTVMRCVALSWVMSVGVSVRSLPVSIMRCSLPRHSGAYDSLMLQCKQCQCFLRALGSHHTTTSRSAPQHSASSSFSCDLLRFVPLRRSCSFQCSSFLFLLGGLLGPCRLSHSLQYPKGAVCGGEVFRLYDVELEGPGEVESLESQSAVLQSHSFSSLQKERTENNPTHQHTAVGVT